MRGQNFLKNVENLEIRERVFKAAFTLAEVLITLGIIGVVAAMTIPTLMTSYAKHKTETQLVKFYSMMNQTLRMSVAENGDPDGWVVPHKAYTYEETVEFLNTYIYPYMKHLGYRNCTVSQISVCTTLMDGSLFVFSINVDGGDIVYYTAPKYRDLAIAGKLKNIPRYKFLFQFAKRTSIDGNDKLRRSVSYIEPYIFNWDGTKKGLEKDIWACVPGCKNCGYCAKRIQMNSWKIPSDYPW